MTATLEIYAFTDADQRWQIIGTHDADDAITAIRQQHTETLTTPDFDGAHFGWGRWVEPTDISSHAQIDACAPEHPDAVPYITLPG